MLRFPMITTPRRCTPSVPAQVAFIAACGVLTAGAWFTPAAWATDPAPAVASAPAAAHSGGSATAHAGGARLHVGAVLSQPEWKSLSPSQQAALAPLAPHWSTITEGQKRKWVEISRNFNSLPSAEQQRIHARMSEWVMLSNRERAQARLNYADVKALPPDARREQWQAYQALPAEQKQKLAAQAAVTKPLGAAVPPKPVASGKLAVTAAAPVLGSGQANATAPLPKIVTAPKQVAPITLLPKAPPAAPAVPRPAPRAGSASTPPIGGGQVQ